MVEVDRQEWPDPATFDFNALQDFLVSAGVCGSVRSSAAAPVGAALFLGGDIRPAGGAPGPQRSPAGGVPAACAVVYASGSRSDPAPTATARIANWTQSWTADDHAAAVSRVREAISAGEVYQANIIGHQSASFAGDPGAVGDALAGLAHTPYAGGMSGAGWSVFSASPECLLEVRDGVATTRPIKGTAAALADPVLDEEARDALANSEKDRAEHVMIVDLARNDLGRVARVGGVSVPELYAVRRLAGVWHAESTVTARLTPGVSLSALLTSIFPGGSVTGAPKLAALRLIDRLEPVGRGPSMGAMGWISSRGELRLGLTIRTVAVTEGRIHLWTGGGITWGSRPYDEVAEAAVKAAPLLRALQPLQA